MRKVSICLLLVICLLFTGCGEEKTRNVVTVTDFENASINSGFEVRDNMSIYGGVNYITEAKVAEYDDIDVEFIKYSSSDYAIQVQDQQVESFNLLKSTGAFVEKEKGSNYYDYALISNGRYMVSTRVDDTLIFAKVMLEDKELVENIINTIGY